MQLFTKLDERTGKMLLIKTEVCAVKSEGNIFKVLYRIIRTDCFVNYLIFIFPLVCLIFSHLLKVLPFLCVVVSLQGRYSKMPDCACHPIRILHFIGFWTHGK